MPTPWAYTNVDADERVPGRGVYVVFGLIILAFAGFFAVMLYNESSWEKACPALAVMDSEPYDACMTHGPGVLRAD